MSALRRGKHLLELLGFRVLAALVRALPLETALRVGAAAGSLAFTLGFRRSVAVRNVSERLAPRGGRAEAEDIARRSYAVAGRTFISLLRLDRITESALWRVVDRDSIVHVRHAMTGHGAMLVSGHFGNWELLVLGIRRSGVEVASMAGDQANVAVDSALRATRARAGTPPISARSGLREAMRRLREGGVVATLMDQDARSKGEFVDFLGAPASAHVGVASLAMRAGVPLVPGVLVDESARYRFVLGPLWHPDPARSTEENELEGAAHFHRFLEAQVREHPDNYFWAHRRWKTRPPAERGGAA